MMPLATIEFLISTRRKDAKALLQENRNEAAIYLCGYAVELALKRKICKNFSFTQGFPEDTFELNSFGVFPFRINEIKTHNLNKLLFYSGKENYIKSQFINEWQNIASWNPENRYKKTITKQKAAIAFLNSTKIIIKALS